VLKATLRERLKFERSWIMRACKGARTLADVRRNVRREMDKAKGLSADVYIGRWIIISTSSFRRSSGCHWDR
jgi:hypothetical protein